MSCYKSIYYVTNMCGKIDMCLFCIKACFLCRVVKNDSPLWLHACKFLICKKYWSTCASLVVNAMHQNILHFPSQQGKT